MAGLDRVVAIASSLAESAALTLPLLSVGARIEAPHLPSPPGERDGKRCPASAPRVVLSL
ncbi:protein of unknown function [Candidatus Bipolaricaulis anaerobius]|uniref:Uncharacterized protein n=1 Tax=Candidatus Bipolaricaulis anaerobius TaxID=2026885 RepID=A0A2X3KI55_9BACT|nr:protein of unknown function [Candidatus Bipolaricaulis anaerobius]